MTSSILAYHFWLRVGMSQKAVPHSILPSSTTADISLVSVAASSRGARLIAMNDVLKGQCLGRSTAMSSNIKLGGLTTLTADDVATR